MAILNKGHDFSDGDQVTAAKLDSAVDSATFAAGSVDNASTQLSGGAIVIKDSGVTAAKISSGAVTAVKLASNAVTTDKIADANVTTDKILNSNVTTDKIANAGVTTDKIADSNVTFAKLTDVIDDDTMSTATSTNLATAESIKAYVDNYLMRYSGVSFGPINLTTSFQTLDLSSEVGSNRANVQLEVYGGSTARDCCFRRKGELYSPYLGGSYAGWGSSGVVLATSSIGGVINLTTDESGHVEYNCSAGSSTGVTVVLVSYQKLI
jgi:hypothetical protein